MEKEKARCSTHGLAAGPDGRCVLCRKAGPTERKGGGRLWIVALVVLLGGLGMAIAVHRYRKTPSGPVVSPRPNIPEPVVPAPAAPAVAQQPSLATSPTRRSRPTVEKDWRTAAESSPVRRAPTRHRASAKDRRPAQELMALRRIPIELYCTDSSVDCLRARRWLASSRLRVIDHDIGREAAAKARLHALNPRRTVPTLSIAGKVLTTFSPDRVWKALRAALRRRTP